MSRIPIRREPSRDAGRRRSRPRVEGLEDRMLLFAPNGGEWAFPSHVTFSFVPDGTDVGGARSNLDATMAVRNIAPQTWRDQFRKAFAAWEVAANIDFVEVSDDGSPLSEDGYQQGDSRFGDIRVAGISSGLGILGTSFLPPPINGGTLAGDILMNTAFAWRINSDYDVMTVALHEIGHSIGMGHSSASQTVMGGNYNGMQQTLKTDDVNGIVSIYGTRPADRFEGSLGNNVITRATPINGMINGQLQARIGGLNLSTGADADWFYVTAPAGSSGQMTVSMQSEDLSLLGPRVMVYNAAQQGLTQVSSTAWGATVTTTISGVVPGTGYYIKAMASGGGATAGAYGLIVNFSNKPADPIDPPVTVVTAKADLGGGGSGLLARLLPRRIRIGACFGFGDELTVEGHDEDHRDGAGAPTILGTLPADPAQTGITTEAPRGPRRRRP